MFPGSTEPPDNNENEAGKSDFLDASATVSKKKYGSFYSHVAHESVVL